jgi:putative ABC transport system permease protein
MKGQALAIALVIVSGVATFSMSLSTIDSLKLTQKTFYQEYRFADVFASLKRAPENLRMRISEIPGVDQVETRVVAPVNLDVPDYEEPVTGLIISIPDDRMPRLNGLYVRQGSLIDPVQDNKVLVSEAFAQAHGFTPGDELKAIINGRRKTFTISGIALSPEYVYQIRPGDIVPDYERYGILWMGRTPLATAYDMEGAFNDVILKLSAGAHLNDVIDRLDNLLEPYGGLGTYGRKDQLSHHYLSQEFKGLEQMATVIPVIFLGVAAFLLNVVISRLVNTQREQVAILKAFGYRNIDIGVHYIKLVLLIVLFGISGGLVVGVWLGKGLSKIYIEFFRFPFLEYELRLNVALTAILVSIIAALAGTLYSVLRAALLPPVEAMRPEPPAKYRETVIERLGVKHLLSQPTRMIARHIERRPLKSLLSITGIAFACAIMMVGSFQEDAVDYMVDVQFGRSQREDLTVSFVDPVARRALYELESYRGVEYGEPFRSVPARLRFQHRSYRTGIQGIESSAQLHRLLNTKMEPIQLPESGIVLSDYLAEMLGVRTGDRLTVEVLEGSRPVRTITVAALVSQYIGVSAYMELKALNRFMREGDTISGVYLAADKRYQSEIYEALKETPRVAGTLVRVNAIKSFYETMAETLLIFTFITTLLAGTIAFGVVYNSARIALSERSRELASLRVLGFTKGEISYILLGELGLLVLTAIPLGFIIGRSMCAYLAEKIQSDLYRIPLIIEPSTYAFAATVVLVSAFISGLIIWRKLGHLDLVAVLKTKE